MLGLVFFIEFNFEFLTDFFSTEFKVLMSGKCFQPIRLKYYNNIFKIREKLVCSL